MRWDIGIDLGTRNVRMVTEGAKEAFAQSAALALRAGEDAPLYCGDAAAMLHGRDGAGLEVCFPLADGTLRNAEHAKALFSWLYGRAGEASRTRRLRALITCAPFARPVQQDALLRAALDAGAVEAGLVRSDAATAVGAGLSILEPAASLLVDVGAGKLSATLFTRGMVAAYAWLPYGVSRIDERLIRLLRTERGFLIGPRTAEEVKNALASAHGAAPVPMRAAGLNLQTRLPMLFDVEPEMVWRAAEGVLTELVGMVASVVDNAPEELAADLNDAVCVLAGGGALISGLDKRLGDQLGIPVRVADAPLACAGAGLAKILEAPEDYELLMMEKMARAARH